MRSWTNAFHLGTGQLKFGTIVEKDQIDANFCMY